MESESTPARETLHKDERRVATPVQKRLDPFKLGTVVVLLPSIVIALIVAVQNEVGADWNWKASLNVFLLVLCLVLLGLRGKVGFALALGVFAYYLFQYILPYFRG